jgi:hypothetical protein
VARQRVRETLSQHYPVYIDPKIDAEIRARYPIKLRPEDMHPSVRW